MPGIRENMAVSTWVVCELMRCAPYLFYITTLLYNRDKTSLVSLTMAIQNTE